MWLRNCGGAAGLLMLAWLAGCGDDVSPQVLTELSTTAPEPKKEEEKPAGDPFALPPGSGDEPAADPFAAPPAPSDAAAGQGGYGSTGTGAPPAGQGGYGSTGDTTVPAGPPDTFGQPAVIRLASEVQGFDLAKAEGGVGRKGQGYGGGIITEPVRQYFIAGDRIKLNIEIPNNLKTYRALNNNQNPPTVEAFVREVLDLSLIKLPELKPGEFYVYDPTGKGLDDVLFVARPPAQ